MAGPFYNTIKSISSGAAGTGAFTPSTASAGYLAWSTVPAGWIGLVRFEDGAAWELQYSYWNGTTLSRAATTQFVQGSSGSALTLTSAATAELIGNADRIGHHAMVPRYQVTPNLSLTTYSVWGVVAPTVTGTASAASYATSVLGQQQRVISTSATTANAQAAFVNNSIFVNVTATAGIGGFDFCSRFGLSGTLPTGLRVFIGLSQATFVANTGEPSALASTNIILGKDSTDTNLQIIYRGTGIATKVDTGIFLALNGLYEINLWNNPSSTKIFALLIRIDTGAIFYTTFTSFDVGNFMFPAALVGLSATTGTAVTLNYGGFILRSPTS